MTSKQSETVSIGHHHGVSNRRYYYRHHHPGHSVVSHRNKKKHSRRQATNAINDDDVDCSNYNHKNKKRRVLEHRNNDIISANTTRIATDEYAVQTSCPTYHNHRHHQPQPQQRVEAASSLSLKGKTMKKITNTTRLTTRTATKENDYEQQKRGQQQKINQHSVASPTIDDKKNHSKEEEAYITIQRERLRIQLNALSMMIYGRQVKRIQRRRPVVPGYKIALIYMDFFVQLHQKGFFTVPTPCKPASSSSSTTTTTTTTAAAAATSTTTNTGCRCKCLYHSLRPPRMEPNYKKAIQMHKGRGMKKSYYKGMCPPCA